MPAAGSTARARLLSHSRPGLLEVGISMTTIAAMRGLVAFGVGAVLFCALPMAGQELEPAAYKVVPINANLFQFGYVLAVGDVNFNPALPVEDAEATINSMTAMYGRTLSFFGRSANFGIVAPITVGHLEGIYIGEFTEVDRTGLRDPMLRLAVNLTEDRPWS